MGFRAMLEKQLELETEAKNRYEKYSKKFKDPEIVRKLERIRDDEARHIKIVQEMLSIL
jgi:rubrerythrin